MKTQYLMYLRNHLIPSKKGCRASCAEKSIIYRHGVRQFTLSDLVYLTDREYKIMAIAKGNKIYLTEKDPHYESYWRKTSEE